MSFNTFGKVFRFTTWGESHGTAIGCIIDGCPPLIQLKEADIQKELNKRKPGQSKFTTQRKESDKVQILSGILDKVDDNTADNYYNSRAYESRIGAWASNQSTILKNREELLAKIEDFKKKYKDKNKVPRPSHWSGWNLNPSSIEFWLDGDNRIHERLKYTLDKKGKWIKSLLSP